MFTSLLAKKSGIFESNKDYEAWCESLRRSLMPRSSALRSRQEIQGTCILSTFQITRHCAETHSVFKGDTGPPEDYTKHLGEDIHLPELALVAL